jgi:uncharacterized membrane protein
MLDRLLDVLRSRVHLALAAVLACAVGIAMPETFSLAIRFVAGWDVGALTFIVLAMAMIASSDRATIRARALALDAGALFVLGVTVASAFVSVAVIVLELALRQDSRSLQAALTAVTVILSWAFIHLVFALHYAHEFELGCVARPDVAPELAGGLDFQGDEPPDYLDFVYFAFIIGVACQTADVVIKRSALRRVALVQGIVAFFFNTTILALAINAAATAFAPR